MGSEGTLKIIGDGRQKKHNELVKDNHGYIIVVQAGNAGDNSGPLFFLANGEKVIPQ